GRERLASHVPAPTIATIPAMFQSAGAAYGRKKRRWALRIPRHHAEMTMSPVIGNRIRTRLMVSWRRGLANALARTVVLGGAHAIPRSARIPEPRSNNPRIAPASA